MFLLAKLISNILSVLNSEDSPKQVAAGFAYGAWIGLLPLKGMFPVLFACLSFLININLGIVAVATGLYKFVSYAVDPIANAVGFFFLTKLPALHPLWTKLYNTPLVPYTRFNNTIVLGSLILGFLLLVPNYFLGKWLVVEYRAKLRDKVLQFKIMKIIRASSLYKYYETYKRVKGE